MSENAEEGCWHAADEDMNKFNFFEASERPTLHVGLRMTKTALAVFICAIIGYLRGEVSAIFSMIAAIMCMQPTRDQSLIFALNRVIGTVIGGVLGALFLYFARWTNVIHILPVYYLLLSLMLIPLIELTLLMRKPSIASFSCIVFLSVTVMRVGDLNPLSDAAERIFETVIGIAVGLLVNWIIPKSKKEREPEQACSGAAEPPMTDARPFGDAVDKGTDAE